MIKKEIKILNASTVVMKMMIIILIINFASSVTTITGLITQGSQGNSQFFNLAGYTANDIIRIKFVATSSQPLTTTFIMADFNNNTTPNNVYLTDFYHKNPLDIQKYDLDAMWNARQQFINLPIPTGATTIYFTIINFDPQFRQSNVSYTIYIGDPPYNTYTCQICMNGANYGGPNGCFCRNCVTNTFGKICSRMMINLDNNSTTVRLDPQVYMYFSISSTNKINLQIQVLGGIIQAYLQFEQFDQQVASFMNVARGIQSDGRYLINNNLLKIGADTQQRKLLITLVSFSNFPINATITYSVQNTVSVLVIVMGVLGGVLLIALIIAVVCIVKKRNSANNRINSQLNLPSDNSKLSGEQIQRYFPLCPYSQLVNSQGSNFESSINQLQKAVQQAPTSAPIATTDVDCVICLEPINQADQIRMGYCKHMFHGVCLISWFKKQRNCPYCRKQYNRDQTVAQYNKLVAENSNKVLKETDLVKAIYNRKMLSKTLIQNIE